MGFLRNLLNYAGDAWRFLAGIPGDIGSALARVWKFVASVAALLDHLISTVIKDVINAVASWVFWELQAIIELSSAVWRVAGWVIAKLINPLRAQVVAWINAVYAWARKQFAAQLALIIRLYEASLAYTRQLVAAEHAAMLKAVAAEHAAMLAAVAALHAAIEAEAAGGYNAGRRARAGVAAKLLDELAVRNPVLRALTGRLVTLIIDLAAIDNPLARLAAAVLIRQLVNRLGVDRVIGDLAARILGPFTGHARPKGLADVMGDIDGRLTALEDQAADFQLHGGPEVEQAGGEWKAITGIGTDAALLAFFALAVADPQQWARAVAGTAGAAVSDTIGSAAALIRRG